jgi:hypothetical protein
LKPDAAPRSTSSFTPGDAALRGTRNHSNRINVTPADPTRLGVYPGTKHDAAVNAAFLLGPRILSWRAAVKPRVRDSASPVPLAVQRLDTPPPPARTGSPSLVARHRSRALDATLAIPAT